MKGGEVNEVMLMKEGRKEGGERSEGGEVNKVE